MHPLLCPPSQVLLLFSFFFFNDTATTEIYTLSLHDALPILTANLFGQAPPGILAGNPGSGRSEEHTSELQSHLNLVCRLLLEKTNNKHTPDRVRELNTHHCILSGHVAPR